MRLKQHPFFGNFIQICQTMHLKSAAIRQNRPLPVHKSVQTTCLSHQIHTRPQIKMVCIAQNNTRIQISQLLLRKRLNRAQCTHRHKNWGFHSPMRRVENPCTRLCSGIGGNHLKPETIDIDNAPPKTIETIAEKKRGQYNNPSLMRQGSVIRR